MSGNEHCDICAVSTGTNLSLSASVPRPSTLRPPPLCSTCGSHRTRVVGQSGNPPLVHYRCDDCRDVSSRALGNKNTDDDTTPPPCPWCHVSGVREITAPNAEGDTQWFSCESCKRVFYIQLEPLIRPEKTD